MAGLLDVFQHKDLAFEPGSRYSYSNSAYVVLAHLLETVSGVSFEEYLQANIFDPVRMDDTGVDHIGRSSRTGPTGTLRLRTASSTRGGSICICSRVRGICIRPCAIC